MTTTENNKLIAEFMGSDYILKRFIGVSIISPANHKFKFDSDWNWLMEVVEKIENLEYNDDRDVFKLVIDYGVCIIYNMTNNLDTIVSVSKPTKIEATYQAVVEFIKWYNQQI